MAKSKVMELAIKIAGKVDKSLGTSTKAANKQLATIQKAANKVSTTMTAGLAAMGTGAIAATKYLADLGGEWQTATNQVAASTGAAGKELEGLRDVMEDVYAANYGDSVADVGDAVAMVNRNMANLDQNGLTAATEGALALRDAFEYDVAESTRAAEAIRKNFGSSAEEAFSLIAAGAQNGLDYSGELIDTINEYSSQFAKLGFDADGMFNILQAGADGTAWNLDKVGDAIKEFSIRAIDGSDSTVEAFTSLGYNAENIMATFAAGGEGANKAFFDVINTLMAVDDQVERDALGVALFGTMWEDLGTEAMEAMAGASQAAYDTEGALEKINQVKYNDLDSAIQGIGRQMEVALLPAADAVYQSLMDSMPEITEAMEEVSPVIAEIAGDFADWAGGAISDGLPVLVDGIRDFANWAGKAYEKAKPFLSFLWEHKGTVLAVAAALRVLGPAIGAVTTAMNAFKTAKTFMALLQSSGKIAQVTAAFQRFGSILTGPLGIIIAVAGAIALLYKNWDTVKAWLVNFGNTVNQIWTNFSNMVGNAIAAIGQKFPMLGAYLQGWWESIQAAVDNVKAIFQNIIDFISNVFSGNWSAAWQNIVNIFGNLFGMIVNLAKAPINGVISAINWVISKINSISVTIPDWVPGVGGKTLGFNIPTIPQLAEGGVATSPTLAEIGEGGEPEAVMPLSKLAALLDEYTKKPKPTGGTDGQEGGDGETIVFSPVLNFYGKADREEVEEATRISFEEFKRLYKRLKAEERRKKFKPEPAMG
ncbi:phage tail tape measure protein [Dysosmobacter sp.]|uniref:phage tail tape measure protein n=1 Tax=Dysosmobacter sp. TaxID=2591382 RepID=UPI003A398344